MEAPLTLVIMAAGAARRYGGLKQLASVGPMRQALMEYSIFDAERSGFGKVVLVVRQEAVAAFREKFADRVAGKLDLQFAYQEPGAFVPDTYRGPERSKPWGTAHAVLCAKPSVPGSFAAINADDFYGPSAIQALGEYLRKTGTGDSAAMVGYQLQNTLSAHGTVNRGVCEAHDGWLSDIVERFEIARHDETAVCRDNGAEFSLAIDATVSMNLWGFHHAMLAELEQGFHDFLVGAPDPSIEFELPTFIKRLMYQDRLSVRVLPTNERWCGMTYQEDLPATQAHIAELVKEGVYPEQLW